MKIITNGDFLSFQELKKKNNDEVFYLSKVLTDSDEMLTVFSSEMPLFDRGDNVEVEININFEKNNIYSSFVM